MRPARIAGAVLTLIAALATAQSIPAIHPNFEVASIRPDSPPDAFAGEFNTDLRAGRLTVRQIVLREFIERAWDVRPFQLSGGPGWIHSQGYDIEAKAEGSLTKDQMRLMMQTLLEERFRLKVHREKRNLPVYNLVVASGGARLQPSKDGGCTPLQPGAPLPRFEGDGPPPVPCGRAVQITTPDGAHMQGQNVLMPELVNLLTTVLGRPIVDKTGWTRAFDLKLDLRSMAFSPGFMPRLRIL
ncbi:MAG TPA: TIGR03435 family protein [Bryobacteraceae bacterium]|jgi:uncharacterized protein (TIGR03435 family)|nr:TIGR03435 family protein [Bryobacteraceae bacterium]